jgi:hypothetical protein
MAESLLNTPILWINTYLQEKLADMVSPNGTPEITLGVNQSGIGVPFFPTKPSTIDELTEQWVVINDVNYQFNGVFAVWDRMFRMRRGPFPHIKTEQVLYYFYGTQSDVTNIMVQVQEAVLRLMDRGDESAQEINDWAIGKTIGNLENRFYFHDFKVYQLEESRDIIDFGTARTYAGNKIIIDYTYHQVGSDGKILQS